MTDSRYAPHLDAKHYRQNSAEQEQLAQRALGLVDIPKNAQILDVGCGDGRITIELAKRACEGNVKGIDPSKEMIAFCNEEYATIPNLIFSQQRAAHIDDIERWDWITSFSALQWVRDPEEAVSRFYKALKPGGKALLLTYPAESPYYEMIRETMEEPKWEKYRSQAGDRAWRTSDQYRTMIEKCGFKINKVFLEDRIIGFESKETLRDFITGWAGCLAPCKGEEEKELVKDIVAHGVPKLISRNDNKLYLPYRLLMMLLQR